MLEPWLTEEDILGHVKSLNIKIKDLVFDIEMYRAVAKEIDEPMVDHWADDKAVEARDKLEFARLQLKMELDILQGMARILNYVNYVRYDQHKCSYRIGRYGYDHLYSHNGIKLSCPGGVIYSGDSIEDVMEQKKLGE